MHKRFLFASTAIAFFCSCVWIFADDEAWKITRPTKDEDFFPSTDITTKGHAPVNTAIVIKLLDFINGQYVTGASKDMSTGPEDPQWTHDFPAPMNGWRISSQWTANLYKDADPLELKKFLPYQVVSEQAMP